MSSGLAPEGREVKERRCQRTDAARVARKDWQTAAVVPDKNGRMFDCGGPLKSSSLDRFCETVARSQRACQPSGEHRPAARMRRTASIDDLFVRDRQTADDESEHDPDCTPPYHAVLCEVAVHDVATKQDQKATDEHTIGEQAGDILKEAVLSAHGLQSGLGQMQHAPRSLTGAKIASANAWGAIIAGMSAGSAISVVRSRSLRYYSTRERPAGYCMKRGERDWSESRRVRPLRNSAPRALRGQRGTDTRGRYRVVSTQTSE